MKITDASVDRQGRLTLTVRLLDRMYQTFRLDEIKIETNTVVESADIGERIAAPFKTPASKKAFGTIRFSSWKVVISNRRPLKRPSKIGRKRG